MKNTFVIVGLALALICVSQIWAQNESDLSVELAEKNATEQINNTSRHDVSNELEEEGESAEESLNRIAKVVRDIGGDEIAGGVVIKLDGMTAEEKAEIADALKNGIHFNGDEVPAWVGVVAILSILLVFGFPIFILIAVFVYLARKRRQKMDIIQVYLDAGKDVPVELLTTFDGGGDSFRSGVMLSAIGLGVLAAFNAANESSVGALGLIPLFIGIAKLVYWFFEERKSNKS